MINKLPIYWLLVFIYYKINIVFFNYDISKTFYTIIFIIFFNVYAPSFMRINPPNYLYERLKSKLSLFSKFCIYKSDKMNPIPWIILKMSFNNLGPLFLMIKYIKIRIRNKNDKLIYENVQSIIIYFIHFLLYYLFCYLSL